MPERPPTGAFVSLPLGPFLPEFMHIEPFGEGDIEIRGDSGRQGQERQGPHCIMDFAPEATDALCAGSAFVYIECRCREAT